MFNEILDFLREVWDRLKKLAKKFLNFLTSIRNWFKEKYRTVIQGRPNVKPIVLRIKKELETNNYRILDLGLSSEETIINTFYDTDTEEILEEDTQLLEADQLDSETIKAFGDKDMLVLS